MYVHMDTQFNLTQIYLNLLMNTVEKEKGKLVYFKKVGNTVHDILVEKDF